MKRIFELTLAISLSLFCDRLNAAELISKASNMDVSKTLVLDRKWVPYPDYSDRAGWESFLGEYRDTLISAGKKYIDFDWKVLRATDYLELLRSGNRQAQEHRLMANAHALGHLMIAELAEGEGRFLDDILNGVFLFCENTSWAMADHLYKFQKSKSPVPDYTDHVLALYQGNISQMLSWAYYFFHKEFDKQDPAFSIRLAYEIKRHELDPFLERNNYDWQGFKPGIMPNNWTPWCNSNAIVCFMLMEDDPERLCAAVMKTVRSVDLYIKYLCPDGACDEGPVYWYASAGNLVNYLECLSLITGGKLTVWDTPVIRNLGEYIVNANITGNWQANFSDAVPCDPSSPTKIFRYGKDVNSPLMKSYAVHCKNIETFDPVQEDWLRFYNGLEAVRCARTLNSLPDKGFKPSDFTYYPDTELAFIRSGKAYLAAKGGHNKERHNHNDVGSFIYFYDNVPVFVDAGPGRYTRDTFNNLFRYKLWNISSEGHNLPVINGCAQAFGREYRAVETSADRRTRTFSTDIAGAYPDSAEVESCRLSYSLLKDGSLQIDGSYEMRRVPDKGIVLHFMSPRKPELAEAGKVGLNGGVTMHYDASLFDASFEEIPIKGYGDGMNEAFGDWLYRLVLTEKQAAVKGSYHLKIEK